MYRNKRSQGFSITIIVAAIVGLMSIVIVIALLSGKLGGFSSGLESSVTCQNTCETLGADSYSSQVPSSCVDDKDRKEKSIPGTFSDITLKDNACCCRWVR